MDTFFELLMSRLEHLLGRTGGPLHFRLLIMPLVVTFFAVRAAMRDARAGQPPFFRTLLLQPSERPGLVRSMLKDVGQIFIVAVVLDTTYQLMVLKAFYLGELLVVVMVSALLPYLAGRSAVAILMRRVYRKHPDAASPSAADPTATAEARPAAPPTTDH